MSRFPRTVLTAALIAALASPSLAQEAAAPPAPAQVQALPPPPPPVVLPEITAAQAAELAKLIGRASLEHGLRRDGTPPPVASAEPQAVVRAALDYARAVRAGRLDTADFIGDWGLRPEAYDPVPAFAEAVKRDRLAAWVASLAPPYAGYDGLQKGLATYRAIRDKGGWATLAAGPDLGRGAKGPRVAALRKRLAVEDAAVTPGDSFDAATVEAVQRAQRRYGLNPTGVVSTGTLGALNVPAEDRVRQIMANMERWRWLPAEMPKDRIQVNIAAAIVTVFEGDQPIMSMRGVTGRPENATPMLKSTIHSIVVNPPWNVPAGIAAKELFPKGAAYLTRNGYKVIGTGPNRRLQQAAGPQSALGRFKFDFDNPYAVYLHDTPTKGTFGTYSRLASHGCIRLEKPQELAQLLLRDDSAWGADAIQAAVDEGKTQRVQLARQAAVYLLYWTAFASQSGTMNFRGDPYSWDSLLASKIEKRSAIQTVAAR
jgi:murein L,D-transpeptidase YcbB/YkuD